MVKAVRTLWTAVTEDPALMRKIHGWSTIVWFVAAFPICILLADSIPFLVFVSVYAVVIGHWSSYQAVRVEVRQEEDSGEDN
jgi:hypothetical protein